MKVDFSIVLLSRNRQELLLQLLNSIKKTSTLNNEVIIGCDCCGEHYGEIHDFPYNCTFAYRKRRHNLHTYMNEIAELSSGDYIFVLNDDCLFLDSGWDAYCRSVLDQYPVCYGRTRDDSIDRVSHDYAAFPVISRAAFEKIGFLMDETMGNHGSDVITYRIYRRAGLVVDLPKMRIAHVYHNSQEALVARQIDKTATDMIRRTFNKDFNVKGLFDHTHDKHINEQAKKLLRGS